jgi:tetratricopeptide (TPR) repeat protein
MVRQDFVAASHLVRRALALVPQGEIDVPLEIDLADTFFSTGQPERAYRSVVETAERAAALGDRIGELCARLDAAVLKSLIEPQGAGSELDEVIAEASPELEVAGDEYALYLLHFTRSAAAHFRCRYDEEIGELEQMLYHAGRTGLPHVDDFSRSGGGSSRFFGAMPVADILSWIDEREARFGPDWRMLGWRAASLALLGRFEDARRLMAEFNAAHEERGDLLMMASHLSQIGVLLELLAGDPAAAAQNAARGCGILEEAGERGWLSTSACYYAQALYELDRLDEAKEWAQKGLDIASSEDLATQVFASQVLAKVAARHGQHAEAERLARAAVTLSDGTGGLLQTAEALDDLSEVLELAGRRDEAAEACREALDRYERKGALAPAARVRERLAALEPASA